MQDDRGRKAGSAHEDSGTGAKTHDLHPWSSMRRATGAKRLDLHP